ncbi:MAG TPA: hypothetical protein VMK42_02605 [Anaeromyxobacteraceae bacterium]|nr:hypothetical protein [Anaeromyxobacteraceae bacterium]
MTALVLLSVLGCGGSSTPASSDAGSSAVITIQNFTFSPQNLTVPAGTNITVKNMDGVSHTVTSSTTPTSFTPGSVAGVSFDTGPFMGTANFTIPTGAPSGTVIPYYCKVHLSGMLNRPTITIQ